MSETRPATEALLETLNQQLKQWQEAKTRAQALIDTLSEVTITEGLAEEPRVRQITAQMTPEKKERLKTARELLTQAEKKIREIEVALATLR